MRKMIILSFIGVILLSFFNCNNSIKKEVSSSASPMDKILFSDFDTIQVISSLNLVEKQHDFEKINAKIDNLSETIDTLILTYYFGFCDCQRWVISNIHEQASNEIGDIDELDPRGQVQFNLDQHGYYIDAASPSVSIDWRYEVNGTKVKFIGRSYKDKRLPNDWIFTVEHPPKGNVFKYYGYEVIKPYKVWGPRVLEKVDHNGDSSIMAAILEVR